MKCIRGVDGTFSLALTQPVYQTGNEWIGARVSWKRDKLFKIAQKMRTYYEMSTTKGHPWVPQKSQDYVLLSPNVYSNYPP